MEAGRVASNGVWKKAKLKGGKRISSVPHQRPVLIEEPADHVHGDREGDTVPDLLDWLDVDRTFVGSS